MKSGIVTIICLISILALKGIQAQCIECYTCTDIGDGGCLPDKAVNVSCSPYQDMCVETITAIKTSHNNHVVLKKGCGYGSPTMLEKSILAYGLSVYLQLNQCNSSLCNNNMDLKHYQLAPDDNVTREANDDQCYSCIGTPKAECSPTSAPVMQCYDTYSHCYDGNVTISIGNDTTVVPIKSCSMRYRCSMHSIAYGSINIEMKGACCSESLCNTDLSNNTQLANVPYLILLNDQNEEQTTTVLPPQWLTKPPETETTLSHRSAWGDGNSSKPQGSKATKACGLSFSLFLFIILIILS